MHMQQVEKDDNVSILRIHNVSSRDVGEIRCTASVAGKGPSISCTAELRLNRSLRSLEDCAPIQNDYTETRRDKIVNCTRSSSLRKTRRDVPLKTPRHRYGTPTRARSSSLPLQSAPSPEASPLPTRKRVCKALVDTRRMADEGRNKIDRKRELPPRKPQQKVARLSKKSKDKRVPSSDEEESKVSGGKVSLNVSSEENSKTMKHDELAKKLSVNSDSVCKIESDAKHSQDNGNKHDNTPIICVECTTVAEEVDEASTVKRNGDIEAKGMEDAMPKEFLAAAIIRVPADVTVFRGNRVVLRVTYQGHPEPRVKWLRAVNV